MCPRAFFLFEEGANLDGKMVHTQPIRIFALLSTILTPSAAALCSQLLGCSCRCFPRQCQHHPIRIASYIQWTDKCFCAKYRGIPKKEHAKAIRKRMSATKNEGF